MFGLILDNCAVAFTEMVGIKSSSIFVKVVILIDLELNARFVKLKNLV